MQNARRIAESRRRAPERGNDLPRSSAANITPRMLLLGHAAAAKEKHTPPTRAHISRAQRIRTAAFRRL